MQTFHLCSVWVCQCIPDHKGNANLPKAQLHSLQRTVHISWNKCSYTLCEVSTSGFKVSTFLLWSHWQHFLHLKTKIHFCFSLVDWYIVLGRDGWSRVFCSCMLSVCMCVLIKISFPNPILWEQRHTWHEIQNKQKVQLLTHIWLHIHRFPQALAM